MHQVDGYSVKGLEYPPLALVEQMLGTYMEAESWKDFQHYGGQTHLNLSNSEDNCNRLR